jgi:hypothetical protein
MQFDLSKSFPNSKTPARDPIKQAGNQSRTSAPVKPVARPVGRGRAAQPASLDFSKSLARVTAENQMAEAARISGILHPDLSNRLRFPSQGDPPREKPKRGDFRSEQHFHAALNHWNQEQNFEAEVYRKALR